MSEQELDKAVDHILGQMDRVILDLHGTMMQYDRNDILEDREISEYLAFKILAAFNALNQASSVLVFLKEWKGSEDPPSFRFYEVGIPTIELVGGKHD